MYPDLAKAKIFQSANTSLFILVGQNAQCIISLNNAGWPFFNCFRIPPPPRRNSYHFSLINKLHVVQMDTWHAQKDKNNYKTST